MTEKYYRPSQEHQGFLAAIDCFQRLHDREIERLTTKTLSMNITNEQPPVKETYPADAPLFKCNGIDHDLGGLCMENLEAYKAIVEDNDDNKVLAAIRMLDIYHVLVQNIADGWDIPEYDVTSILGMYLSWAKESNGSIRAHFADDLRKKCKKTNIGEELADMLIKMA